MERYALSFNYTNTVVYYYWSLNRPVISLDSIAFPGLLRPYKTPKCDVCLAIL